MNKKNVRIKAGVFLIISLFLMVTATANAKVYPYIPVSQQDTCFPSQLEPGDVLFMDAKQWVIDVFHLPHANNTPTEKSNDHVALYIGVENGVHMFIEANNYSIYNNAGNFTLPGGSGVQKTPWWVFCFWATNFTIGKLKYANLTQRQVAINNAKSLLGKKYQSAFAGYPPYFIYADPNITDPANPYYHKNYYYPIDPHRDYFFCAELVWTCYLRVMPSPINLDPYPDPDGTYMNNPAWGVYPNTLLYSTNMTFISVTATSYSSQLLPCDSFNMMI
jgi:hypothetical protein